MSRVHSNTVEVVSAIQRLIQCIVKIQSEHCSNTMINIMWVEWQFEQEWSDEKNSALMFGTSNRNKNGKKFAA